MFELDGELLVPTELALGPWDPGYLHGGPVAAALLRAMRAEAETRELDGRLVRFALELGRPVPRAPMRARAEVRHAGRRSQTLEAVLEIDGEPVSRAAALLLAPPPAAVDAAPYPDDRLVAPDSVGVWTPNPGRWQNFTHAFDWRSDDPFTTPGPTVCWARLRGPMVAGEATDPAAVAIAVADYGSAITQVLPYDTATFVNPDLTVYLHRVPASAWIGLQAVAWMDAGGSSFAESALYDEHGRVGRGLQSVSVALR